MEEEKMEIPDNNVRVGVATRPKKRGRPRKEAPRRAVHEPARKVVRSGKTVVTGRDGEVLTRKRTGTADPFYVNPEMVPDGWEYQWNAVTLIGNAEVYLDQQLTMQENGWRPVPAERHAGRYMPVGHKGSIIRGGLRLDERPKSLCDEARAEDLRNAYQLMSDRNESLRLTGLQKNMPGGFSMDSRRYRNTGGNVDVRMSIDPSMNVPRPSHTLAGPEE